MRHVDSPQVAVVGQQKLEPGHKVEPDLEMINIIFPWKHLEESCLPNAIECLTSKQISCAAGVGVAGWKVCGNCEDNLAWLNDMVRE